MGQDDLGDLTARLKLDTSDATSAVKGVADGFPLIGAAAVAAAGAVAAIGVVSTDMAAKFQQSLTLVQTQAGDTTDNINQLGDALMNLAPQVGQTPEELAKAFFHLASAGYTGAQGLDILRQSAELADIGQSNLEQTTDAVVGALKSGVPGIKSAADAVSVLNAIVGSGNMHMQDLVDAMGSGILAVAGTFKISIQSVGAALSFMTDQGIPAADAATRLKMSMALMVAPTAQATKLLTDAGLSAKDAADETSAMQVVLEKAHVTTTKLAEDLQQPDGFVVALQDLKTNMDKAGVSAQEQAATIARAFGGGKSGSALIDLYNNLDGVRQKFDDINKGAGRFGQDWQTQSQTASQRAADFKAQLDALAIRVGNIILPAATEGLSLLTQLLGHAVPAVQAFATAASERVAPALEKMGTFIHDKVVPVVQELGRWFEEHIVPVLEKLGAFVVSTVIPALQQLWGVFANQVLPIIQDVAGWFADHVAPVLINLAQTIIPPLVTILGDTVGGLVAVLKAVYGAAQTFVNWVKEHWPELTPVLAATAIVLGPLIGAFIAARVQATIATAQMGIAWAAWSAGAVLQNGIVVASAIASSAATSAAWIASAAKAVVAWAVGFVTQMAASASAAAASAGPSAALAAGEWSGAATAASGAWAAAASSIALSLTPVLAIIADVLQGIHNVIHDWENSPLGQGKGANPLPPPSDWRSHIPGSLGNWSGGFVPPGQWGVINETGPELLYGGPHGTTVFPRGGEPAGAAGQTIINVYVTAPQASPDEVANEIAWAMK